MEHQTEVPGVANTGQPQSDSSADFKLGSHSTRDVLSSRDVAELARRRNYAVRVFAERSDGIVTQQVFAQLEAAERKAERVRARGLAVRLELVHLVPVQPLDGGDAGE